MKSDWFRRGVRMQHQFNSLEERNDPLGQSTWFPEWPKRPDRLSGTGRPCEIQEYGEHMWTEPRSAVSRPDGTFASLNGRRPDLAEAMARPFPVGTKRRLGPLKTDK